MKKPTLREMFTIPNILSYFRILLIPLFVYLYFKAETPPEFFRAAVVLGISGFTDLFDGKIARRFNQITELGILLDPVADKLTEGAVVLCLMTRYRWVAALVVLLRGDVKVAVAADYGFVAEDRVAVVDLRPDACAACDSDRAQFRVCVVARVLISGAKQRRLCAFDMDRRKAGQTARDQCVVGG